MAIDPSETAQMSVLLTETRVNRELQARRERAEERRQRFLDARKRTMGVSGAAASQPSSRSQ
jgi:hypothetical protein